MRDGNQSPTDPGSTRISIELVPRDAQTLRGELQLVRERFPAVSLINIPDLPRFDLRSWDGCLLARDHFSQAVPHIRAVDCDPSRPLPMVEALTGAGIDEVLVIQGDPHPDPDHPQFPDSTSLAVIARFKREMPGVRVYAAIDPYRTGFRQEYEYCQKKLDAGADGFFTQPFFDQRLMEIYVEVLSCCRIFWGVSPVTTPGSRNYWETRNRVLFPKRFEPTLAWNRAFARQALRFARESGTHIYFMPIRTDIAAYLDGILD